MSKNTHEEYMNLVRKNQLERFFGGCKAKRKENTSRHYRDKEVHCVLCGRKMTAPQIENPPFYCYKCDEEAEAVFRDSNHNHIIGTPPENLERDKRIRDYEDYFNGKAYTGKR